MNKKGFTLVELLAVIIILSLLALVASTTITKIVKNSKTELYNAQIELIKVAAQTWGEENIDKLPNDGECKYLTLKNLKTYGMLEESIINPQTNKEFSNEMNIKITSTLTDYSNVNFKYEVDAIDVSECTPTYPLCLLVSDADSSNTITPGDKYLCRVKDVMEKGFESGYYFYVLGYNDKDGNVTEDLEKATTLNLIMERNICDDGTVATEANTCLTAWMNQTDYELAGGSQWDERIDENHYGPVTAMNYIYKATKDWNNVPNMIVQYDDDNYGGVKTTGALTQINNYNNAPVTVLKKEKGYMNLKARLPLYSELNTVGCLSVDEGNMVGSCPTYLMDYLSSSPYYSNLTNIPNIDGYWTLQSFMDYHARYIDYDGYLAFNFISINDRYGVRPVITIPKTELE